MTISTNAQPLIWPTSHRQSGPLPIRFPHVLEGTSERGVITARRRLVQLYRACGLEPREGEEIRPRDLCQARLSVKVEHDEWNAQRRLRAVAYRAR